MSGGIWAGMGGGAGGIGSAVGSGFQALAANGGGRSVPAWLAGHVPPPPHPPPPQYASQDLRPFRPVAGYAPPTPVMGASAELPGFQGRATVAVGVGAGAALSGRAGAPAALCRPWAPPQFRDGDGADGGGGGLGGRR
jgi:hypothetical protein